MKRFLREQLVFALPIFAVLLIALSTAYLSVSLDAPRIPIVPFYQEGEIKTIMINVLFVISIASLSVPFFYFALKKRCVYLLERMFTLGGGLLTLFFSGVFSWHLFKLFPSFLTIMLSWVGMFFIGLSIAFTVTNVFSEETRNIVSMIYGSVAGSFLGMGVPMFSMVFILISLCVLDVVFIRSLMKSINVLLEKEKVFVRLKYSNMELMIGFGDLIYYSMFVSYSVVNFGTLTAIVSTFLILVGLIFTFFYTTKSEVFPGLPIPIGLGMIPVIIKLTFVTNIFS